MPGVTLWPGFLDGESQRALVAEIERAAADAPFYTPHMPRTGKPMSVEMTNLGRLGWLTDKEKGYRYEPVHPETRAPWPAMPRMILDIWRTLSGQPAPPEACLVNRYGAGAKMGLHQDRDEEPMEAPVLSVSLGDSALFRVGGTSRKDPTRSFRLASGDVMMLAGPARLAFHGIDRVYPGTSRLIASGGRLNLTLRRVTRP